MKIEQGMLKEEGQSPRKDAEAKLHVFAFLVAISSRGPRPSSFNIPCSTFFGSRGGWGHRVVDGFAAPGPSVVIVAVAGWIDPDVYSGLYDKAGRLNARELPVCVNT